MMPVPIPHKTLSIVLGHEEPGGDEADHGNEQGLQAAAEDLIAAVHGKDSGAVAEALKNAVAICSSMDAGDDEEHQEELHSEEG